MFGLEKNKTSPLFEFDLEKELKQDAGKTQKLLQRIESKIQELKNVLRQGANSKEFDDSGILLHGYAALQRVLNRISRKK
ncbi:MAG: DUF5398 family protein [Simkania sp.]|nr:DUF5398 family protein [Simkania sp.]